MTENSSPDFTASGMTARIAGDAFDLLEYLARSEEISRTEALKQALVVTAYLRQEIGEGSRILVKKPDGEIREIVFSEYVSQIKAGEIKEEHEP